MHSSLLLLNGEKTMIQMEHVCKTYKIAKRNAGFKEACKSFLHREYEEIPALHGGH